jgi:hypothetical protein
MKTEIRIVVARLPGVRGGENRKMLVKGIMLHQ